MSQFKYISVVMDGLTNTVEEKPKYRVLEFIYEGDPVGKYSLIYPLNGASANEAAQKYLFDNPREWFVYVRVDLPETKYQKFEDRRYGRTNSEQFKLSQEREFKESLKEF